MNRKVARKIDQRSTNSESDKAIGRRYAYVAFGAYFASEIFILTGIQPEAIDKFIAFGGISSYGLSLDRERDLVIHLAAQTSALPAYLFVNHRAIANAILAKRQMGIKAFLGGPFLAILFTLLLYTPAQSQTNPEFHRFNALHVLVARSDLAYSLIVGFCVALIGLGLQVPTVQTIRFFKKWTGTQEDK